MSSDAIKEKLIKNGFENYISIFEENHIMDSEVLKSMTNEDYQSIGISILGDRKKLLSIFQDNKALSSSKTEIPQVENKTSLEPNSNYQHSATNKSNYAWVSSKSRLAALLFSIFLGDIGIHNFYLGEIGRGIIKIAMTFIGAFLYSQSIKDLLSFRISFDSWQMIIGIIILCAVSIWNLVEMIIIACGKAEDIDGMRVSEW